MQQQQNKKRSSRATTEQYKVMLDFFVTNNGLAEGKFLALHGRQEAINKWAELAGQLNSVGGAEKSAAQWQVAWRDLKSRTSVKARERRKEMAKTGGKPLSSSALTELDMRVLDIIGLQYVEGSSNCADSIPEEEHLQVALERGEDEVLLACPMVPSTFPYEVGDPVEEVDVVDVDMEMVEVVEVVETAEKKKLVGRNVRPKKRSVLDSAREQFAAIAKQQANAIMIQAEAAKQQAEATMKQAEATKQQAEATEQQNEIAKQQNEFAKQQADAVVLLAVAVDRIAAVMEQVFGQQASD